MEVTVFNIEGQDSGRKIELKESIFGVESNDHAIYLDAKQYMANNRQGTHKAKERCDISGSTRKIKKQKGTGTARAGSIKSPLFRGGGRVFGPEPRNYRFKLNKKVKQLARCSVLSAKLKSDSLIVVEDFNYETPKTKNFVALSKSFNIENKKSLLVLAEPNKNVYLSSRNLKDTKVVTLSELTTYDILRASVIMFAESSVNVLQK